MNKLKLVLIINFINGKMTIAVMPPIFVLYVPVFFKLVLYFIKCKAERHSGSIKLILILCNLNMKIFNAKKYFVKAQNFVTL